MLVPIDLFDVFHDHFQSVRSFELKLCRLMEMSQLARNPARESAIGYRLSAIGYRLSAIAYRLSRYFRPLPPATRDLMFKLKLQI